MIGLKFDNSSKQNRYPGHLGVNSDTV